VRYTGIIMSQRVSALIIAPPGRLRDGMRVLLRATGRIARVEQADDARSGLQSIAARAPGLVLLDADLGDDDTRGMLQQLETQWPQLPCLVLVHNLGQEHMVRAAGDGIVLQAGFATETFFSTIDHLLGDRDTI
jgi:DNA-binding NarL/FixJ family response regulator